MPRTQWIYRDVSTLLQSLRNFLLGRKHTLHPRFPCAVSPRSIPMPDIPRGPYINRYSEVYYDKRNPYSSVYPPVVAPVAMGIKDGACKPVGMSLPKHPTPGSAWWWDGHSYYECGPDLPPRPVPEPLPCPPAKAPPPSPPARKINEPYPCPPCPPAPDKKTKH